MRLPDPKNSWAVFIGTSVYDGEFVDHPLPGVLGNVEDLTQVLSDPRFGGFRREHCVQLVDESRLEILRALKTTAEQATDVLLVYVAGHAMPRDPASLELFFCLPSTNAVDSRHWNALRHAPVTTGSSTALDSWHWNALPYSEIRDIVRNSPAANRIVIVDSCFSGRTLPELMGVNPAQLFDVRGAYTLTSAGPNEFAVAPRNARCTAFTGKLVELLTEGIDGSEEMLSLPTLFPYLKSGLFTERHPLPHQQATDNAPLLAVVRNRACGTKSVIPADLDTAINSSLSGVRRAALDELAILHAGGSTVTRNRVQAEVFRLTEDSNDIVATEAHRLMRRFDAELSTHTNRGRQVSGRTPWPARVRAQLSDRWWIGLAVGAGLSSAATLGLSGYGIGVSALIAAPIAILAYLAAVLLAA